MKNLKESTFLLLSVQTTATLLIATMIANQSKDSEAGRYLELLDVMADKAKQIVGRTMVD